MTKEEYKDFVLRYKGCGDWDNDFHTCRVYLQHEELQMYIEQLTKAKEVIRELIYADGRFADSYPQLINRAEQFLNEE